MYVERVHLTNFRCFGPEGTAIDLDPQLCALVGANGTGKTALLQALLRMFGISGDQRRVRRRDFHVPAEESDPPLERTLAVEVILAFPELSAAGADDSAVPEFFHQMAADDAGALKCRIRLSAVLTEDGTAEGAIEQKVQVIQTMGVPGEEDVSDLKASDRARIQMIYVPATRDASSQVAAFLRGRLWRAVNWSTDVRTAYAEAGTSLNKAFADEPAVTLVESVVTRRWTEIHSAGTESKPLFRTIDARFEEFVKGVEVAFEPDEAGRQRSIDELSDGQRSLFHLALTAATLEVEAQVAADPAAHGFLEDGVAVPALTLIAIEEPENNLAPFYLSRIVRQVTDLTEGGRAQAILSSHSASILARVAPSQVRHFRLEDRVSVIRPIRMPAGEEEAAKYVREAVHAYPELYFAKFVILGEGASEEIVLPRLAGALGCDIDRSFVAVVPLGGRHVNHLWRLLNELAVPHATLVDLDFGRGGGGWGRIKYLCHQLLSIGVPPGEIWEDPKPKIKDSLAAFDGMDDDLAKMKPWLEMLERHGVYFSRPLDIDYAMLRAFPDAYRQVADGGTGPSPKGEPREAVLGEDGDPSLYGASHDVDLRWYRYLFLGRGKPSTHVRALAQLEDSELAEDMPASLERLLEKVKEELHAEDPLA